MQVEQFLSRLQGVKKLPDGSWMALCPCHEDTNPSLHISEKEGRVLVYCFGCRAGFKEVTRALGLDTQKAREPYKFYDYRDEDGNLLYQKVRFYPKDFRFRTPLPGGGFRWDTKGVRHVLYNLPEVKNADTVYIVEGEKDADRLMAEGLVATTNDTGAGKWDPTYSQALVGKKLIIVPDNDQPGKEHAELVALSTWRVAKEIKIVELPGLPEGGDVSDFLKEHSIDEFLEIVKKTAPWTPAPIKKANIEIRGTNARLFFPEVGVTLVCQRLKLHSDGRLTCILKAMVGGYTIPGTGVINLAAPGTRRSHAKALEEVVSIPWQDILEVAYRKLSEAMLEGEPAVLIRPAPKRSYPFLVAGLLPEGMETLLWGPGGAGKSWLALALAYHIWKGEPFLGKQIVKPGKTLYLDWETNAEEFARRMGLILGEGNLFNDEGFLCYKRLELPLIDSLDSLYGIITEFDPVFIVIDSMARAIGGGIMEEEAVSAFFSAVRSLGRTSLIIHHPTKAVLTQSKNSIFYGSAYTMWLPRSVWKLETRMTLDGETIKGVLTQMKTNIGKKQPPVAFRMRIEPWELTPISMEEVKPELPLRELITDALNKGKHSVKDLADILDRSPSVIRKELHRLKAKGMVARDEDGYWYMEAEVPF